jgi:hypothetical protein
LSNYVHLITLSDQPRKSFLQWYIPVWH